jgi:hypothetical protein
MRAGDNSSRPSPRAFAGAERRSERHQSTNRNRSSSRSAICRGDNTLTRAAASSIASGMPSSRRQMRTMLAGASSLTAKPWTMAHARATNSLVPAKVFRSWSDASSVDGTSSDGT